MPNQLNRAVTSALSFVRREPLFAAALLLTAVVSCFSRPCFTAVHWNVIATLFSLMLVCRAFDRCQLLSVLAGKALGAFKTPRMLGLAMIFATGALSMLVTNDVSLLAVVPLTMKMAKVSRRDPFVLVTLETVSANLFSAFTPFGNPQNLYLYSYYRIAPLTFFSMMAPLCLASAVLLVAANLLFGGSGRYETEKAPPAKLYDGRLLTGASAAFTVTILSVFHLMDYRLALAATLLIFLILAPRLFAKVDYFLLLTFVLFFLFSSGVTALPPVREAFACLLGSRLSVLVSSAALSQVISNVPAAVLLSSFTTCGRELVYGVSVGGLGTLVASLASLISYRYYALSYKTGKYLRFFSLLNFGLLFLLLAFSALWDGLL